MKRILFLAAAVVCLSNIQVWAQSAQDIEDCHDCCMNLHSDEADTLGKCKIQCELSPDENCCTEHPRFCQA